MKYIACVGRVCLRLVYQIKNCEVMQKISIEQTCVVKDTENVRIKKWNCEVGRQKMSQYLFIRIHRFVAETSACCRMKTGNVYVWVIRGGSASNMRGGSLLTTALDEEGLKSQHTVKPSSSLHLLLTFSLSHSLSVSLSLFAIFFTPICPLPLVFI